MTFLQYWLKIKWLWYNPNKKSRKKQLLSSVHAVCIQLRELQRLFKETLRLSLSPFSRFKILFFMWCNLTAENKKNFSVHRHKGFVNYIFFPFRHQSTLRLFLLSPLAKIQFICFMYSVDDFVTMDNVERDINSFWEDDINPFTRKNETKCVKTIPRLSVYVPIHN